MPDTLFSFVKRVLANLFIAAVAIIMFIGITLNNFLSFDKIVHYGFDIYFNNITSLHISDEYAYAEEKIGVYNQRYSASKLISKKPAYVLEKGMVVRVEGKLVDNEITWCAVKYSDDNGKIKYGFAHGINPNNAYRHFKDLSEITEGRLDGLGVYNVHKLFRRIYDDYDLIRVDNIYKKQAMIDSGEYSSLEKIVEPVISALVWPHHDEFDSKYENILIKKFQAGNIKKIISQHFDLGLLNALYTDYGILNSRLLFTQAMHIRYGDSKWSWVRRGNDA